LSSRDPFYGVAGSRSPKIVFLGEAWGREEEAAGSPFVGQSGKELFRMIGEALGNDALHTAALGASSFRDWVRLRDEWLIEREIMFTNVVADRPQENELWHLFHPNTKAESVPKLDGLRPTAHVLSELSRLRSQLNAIQPLLVCAVGNYALWATTTCCSTSNIPTGTGATVSVPGGITSWRGSMLTSTKLWPQPQRVLPLIHPAAILREWYLRSPTLHDMRTRIPMALREDWRPHPLPVTWAPPSFAQAKARLEGWLSRAESGQEVKLASDVECMMTFTKHLTCIGFADSKHFAMSIPFVKLNPDRTQTSYWTFDEEKTLVLLIRRILSHPLVLIIGQNFIFDMQHCIRELGVRPRLWFDTMLAQHLLFPGTPKGLDYISSLYCRYHWYWKDDGKEWDSKGTLEQHLEYNALDLLRTFEAAEVLEPLLRKHGFGELWRERLDLNTLALDMMERGVKIDTQRRANLSIELAMSAERYEEWFEKILPDKHVKEACPLKGKNAKPWYRSSTQQRAYFSWLGLKLPHNRKTKRESFGKEALNVLTEKHPELKRMFTALREYRSIGVFHNTFIKAQLEPNNRMKCSFNVAGTETFRWSSSENAFGRGTNLQNIPSGNEE